MIAHFGNAAKGSAPCGLCKRYCVEHACAVCSEYECAGHLAAPLTEANMNHPRPSCDIAATRTEATDIFAVFQVNQTTPSATFHVPTPSLAYIYVSRWSAPVTVEGVAIRPGTGHEFGWNDERWVSLGAYRRGGKRPGQWGERARRRRAKRCHRARFDA